MNFTKTKVVAFDLFGTVFDMSGVSRDELRAYGEHIRKPEWSPLVLPDSWRYLPAHPDSASGIKLLRRHFLVVTCSNGPLGLLAWLSKNAGIHWDGITPLELNRVFKPNPRAYLTVCDVYGVKPEEVLMVTANEHFGDIEAARRLGMEAALIRCGGIKDIVELSQSLGVSGESPTHAMGEK